MVVMCNCDLKLSYKNKNKNKKWHWRPTKMHCEFPHNPTWPEIADNLLPGKYVLFLYLNFPLTCIWLGSLCTLPASAGACLWQAAPGNAYPSLLGNADPIFARHSNKDKPQYLSDILKHFQFQSQKKINESNQISKHFSKYNICSQSIILFILVMLSLVASALCLLRWSWRVM